MSKHRASPLEDAFLRAWSLAQPDRRLPQRQWAFAIRACPPRKFRFDFAWPAERVAVEMEGGVFHGGTGHRSCGGVLRDVEKYNLATRLGWAVLRYTVRDTQDRPVPMTEEVAAMLDLRGGELPPTPLDAATQVR